MPRVSLGTFLQNSSWNMTCALKVLSLIYISDTAMDLWFSTKPFSVNLWWNQTSTFREEVFQNRVNLSPCWCSLAALYLTNQYGLNNLRRGSAKKYWRNLSRNKTSTSTKHVDIYHFTPFHRYKTFYRKYLGMSYEVMVFKH